MGARGSLKLPSHLRAVNAEPAGTAAETVKRELPEPPVMLSDDERALWEPLVETLYENGLTSRADGMVVHALIKHYKMMLKASAELEAVDSLVEEDAKNQRLMKHPAHQIMKDHSAALLQYAQALGMSFTARARYAAPAHTDEQGNPFDTMTGA